MFNMVYIIIMILLFIIGFVLFYVSVETMEDGYGIIGLLFIAIAIIMLGIGAFNGFINYPNTEGTHQGVVTAVDLEGVYFRRYEVYLKSSGYTEQSDETVYCLYDYESDLKEQLQNAIGKKVKLYYGHEGGYIGWKSCGTYHIKKVEVLEEENDKTGNLSEN